MAYKAADMASTSCVLSYNNISSVQAPCGRGWRGRGDYWIVRRNKGSCLSDIGEDACLTAAAEPMQVVRVFSGLLSQKSFKLLVEKSFAVESATS